MMKLRVQKDFDLLHAQQLVAEASAPLRWAKKKVRKVLKTNISEGKRVLYCVASRPMVVTPTTTDPSIRKL